MIASEKRVNAALRLAGVPVEVWTQNGYRSVRTLDPTGPEVDSICVCYWHQMSLEQWVDAATANYERAVIREARGF